MDIKKHYMQKNCNLSNASTTATSMEPACLYSTLMTLALDIGNNTKYR